MTRKILAPYGALKHLAVATKVGLKPLAPATGDSK